MLIPSGSSVVNALYETLLADQGVERFVAAAGEILGSSILVVGVDQRYIAASLRIGPDCPQETAAVLERELEGRHLSERALRLAKELDLPNRIDREAEGAAPAIGLETLGLELLGAPVRIHGVIAAHVLVLSTQGGFSGETVACLPLLASLISQELQKAPHPRLRRTPQSSFLAALLDTVQPQRHIVEHQLEALDYKLRDYYYVAVVEPEGRSFTARDFDMVVQHLQGVLTGNLYVILEDQLVLLFGQERRGTLSNYTLRTLRQTALNNRLTVGISNLATDILELNRFRRQAERAIQYGRSFMKNSALEPVYLYYEYSYGELLDACSAKLNLLDYVYPPLLDLLEYDKQNASNLMDTLFQYLLHNAHTGLTAKSMSIHKNTILYRLNLIKDIMRNDLSAGENLFIINLSLRILTQLELFTPQKVTDPYDMASLQLDQEE